MNYYLQLFLESSTIHGLVYISTESKFARFFWVLVVITGFTIATLLINDSFVNWSESPIKTKIETRPISEISFPKVTVCPPKNTFTDLNYDLMMLENMTVTDKMRYEFIDLARKVVLETNFESQLMSNMSKLEEENRYYNWYHGYSDVTIANWDKWGLVHLIETSATSGLIRTKYFGDKYDPDKVETRLWNKATIYTPPFCNCTLTLEIEKVSMKVSGTSTDTIYLSHEAGNLDFDQNHFVYNFTTLPPNLYIELRRDITMDDAYETKYLKRMPGFIIKWRYNMKIDPQVKFRSVRNTQYKR